MPADVPVTAAATFTATLVDEWRRAGLVHAVVCPGSRSTPLAVALLEGDGVEVHVCLDERSAGFIAVGLARATGRPVPVLTTSGTATANLHPAVVEAHHDGVPLILATADRPPELHGVGAPQTIDQHGLYGGAVRLFVDAGVPESTDPGGWRDLAHSVWSAARGCPADQPGPAPGPVHLNLPFREPLIGVPGPLPAPIERAAAAAGPGSAATVPLTDRLDGARTLVIAGPPIGGAVGELLDACRRMGWPVLIDPRVETGGGAGIARADALLRVPDFVATARPDVVLRLGALPTSKVVGQWLDALDAYQVGIDVWGRRFDPGGSLDELVVAEPIGWVTNLVDRCRAAGLAPAPAAWLDRWIGADEAVEWVLEHELGRGSLTEPVVARMVTVAGRDRPADLVVSSSMPIRDVEWFGVRGPRVHANRGANGIDGVVSTAVGVALGSDRPTIALLGDLAFLHDTNGLLALRSEQPDCTLVVVDNDGGGIFHFLPQAGALDAGQFERLFGTPQALDLVAVAAAYGIPAHRVGSADELAELLATGYGPRCLVVPSDRHANVVEHERLHAAAATVLAP